MVKKKKLIEEIHKQKELTKSTDEVADVLRSLFEEVSRSEVTISGEKLPIDGAFLLSMKKQLKKGVISCELAFQVRLSNDFDTLPDRAERTKMGSRYKPSGGKKLKKDISRLWKDVSKQIIAGTFPTPEDVRDLLKSCEDYSLHANSEWFNLWRKCCSEVKSCVNSAMNEDFVTALEKINEVNRLTRECHKLYK